MKRIDPGRVDGDVPAPPSKSAMQRAVAAATLADGSTEIVSPSYCDDGLAALRVSEALGTEVVREADRVLLRPGRAPRVSTLDCGESGLCIRMFTPIAALFDYDLELVALGSLRERPVSMVEGPVRALGATCSTTGGRAPIRVRGPLKGGHVTLDGSLSSQFLTGLLLALPRCSESSELCVDNLRSKPYVRMTLQLMRDFGVEVLHDDALSRFQVPGGQRYRARTYQIEGDWSGAAFPLVAGATSGHVQVSNLDLASLQADRAVIEALRAAGAAVDARGGCVEVRAAALRGFDFDATHCPDLFPPLVALACACEGTTRLTGAGRLKHKESDRATALVSEFVRLGARVELQGDALVITGGPLAGGQADSHGDHRIAMAVAVAALRSDRGVELTGESCVAKSYPDFFERLDALRRGR